MGKFQEFLVEFGYNSYGGYNFGNYGYNPWSISGMGGYYNSPDIYPQAPPVGTNRLSDLLMWNQQVKSQRDEYPDDRIKSYFNNRLHQPAPNPMTFQTAFRTLAQSGDYIVGVLKSQQNATPGNQSPELMYLTNARFNGSKVTGIDTRFFSGGHGGGRNPLPMDIGYALKVLIPNGPTEVTLDYDKLQQEKQTANTTMWNWQRGQQWNQYGIRAGTQAASNFGRKLWGRLSQSQGGAQPTLATHPLNR